MSLWGRNDQAVTANSSTTKESSNGAPIGTYALVKGDQVNRADGANAHYGNTSPGSRAYTDFNMFGNTTIGAFIPNQAVGIFGIDATEMGISGSTAGIFRVTSGGTGYGANAAVTLTYANGTTNTSAVNSTAGSTGTNAGRITTLTSNIAITGVNETPALTIAAPALIIFNGNTDVTANTIAITSANSKFQVGDALTYAGNTLSTPGGLTDQTVYYVSFVNTSVLALSTTVGGANIALTKATGTATTANGATIQGRTATGYLDLAGGRAHPAAHAGWVVRREGTGGRAGRVHYETLVAMGSLGAQTAAYGTPANVADTSDDTVLPDS